MPRKPVTLDPIHGRIEIPDWLAKAEKIPAVRRMMFIRQLGLKAYVDFPGAIHTRYSHGLGVMHLSGKLGELLEKKGGNESDPVVQNLKDNRGELMAAGFLHDIGHGPFSHAVDFALKMISGKTHEDAAADIIDKELGLLENYGITPSAVKKIVSGKHPFPFCLANSKRALGRG